MIWIIVLSLVAFASAILGLFVLKAAVIDDREEGGERE